ncbi:DUF1028 domain-containing protein [Verticiella sediminum]|nr:DUF1028 domain-containing protein [Verticiella sediminum]
MTFTIAARCPETGSLGICIATSSPAVGSRCVHVMHNVGVIAHQATPEPRLARTGMELLRMGFKAPKVLRELEDGDVDIEFRQIAVIDVHGTAVARTGRNNMSHASHKVGDGFVALGNLLEGAHVVDAIHDAYLAHASAPFDERLLRAIEAGRDAGGQVEGQTSAAILVYDRKAVARIDLRVDLALEPIAELRRQFDWFQALVPFYEERCDNPRVGRHKDWLKERGIERQFGVPPPHVAAERAAQQAQAAGQPPKDA